MNNPENGFERRNLHAASHQCHPTGVNEERYGMRVNEDHVRNPKKTHLAHRMLGVNEERYGMRVNEDPNIQFPLQKVAP